MTAIMQKPFGVSLVKIGEQNQDLVVVDADLQRVCDTDEFASRFPERYFNVGVAEANMVGVATGLALSGKTVFCGSFANFVAQRAGDQVSVGAAYMNTNIKLCGFEAALTSGSNGATHQCMLDLAIMRALPNIRVYDPLDATDLCAIMEYEAKQPGPAYLRGIRRSAPRLIDVEQFPFKPGKAYHLREGRDVTLIASGLMLERTLQAADQLAGRGIEAQILGMSCLKPLDEKGILQAARDTGCIVTAENHNIYGGLGSAVTEVVCQKHPVPVLRVGIPDQFGEVGSADYLAEKFRISVEDIVQAALRVIELKN